MEREAVRVIFTDAYNEKIEAVMHRIEGITDERSEARRQDILKAQAVCSFRENGNDLAGRISVVFIFLAPVL
ncbi:hypothetical protein [[Clostridium] scindens]|uniref:Uncharacterized protein n=1 Tax=Clostridium scindens (strain JCM 10418 / VPI 12708) TaxID=29347 RepID=A0A844F212_CLOSV|nr:hypothetical protein [[Clostridium] scindens]EDS05148.1 hypothetical protein CLOSCI_03760 [[Clostridium] scindens ATCC 35704]MCB6287595.1 hypothetical protein [[Clostridium] scindens]MCB6422274.1 hypothetical protein [[Clostridium] scindens]MEE0649231.1 hypothetical protein [[Clostridium] scindens]MSS39598.1 hypothetical protein [[Clostridium] scindens]